MKLLKTLLLTIVSSFCLMGCSNGSVAGTYAFQMGKTSEIYFGFYLRLYDEEHISPTPSTSAVPDPSTSVAPVTSSGDGPNTAYPIATNKSASNKEAEGTGKKFELEIRTEGMETKSEFAQEILALLNETTFVGSYKLGDEFEKKGRIFTFDLDVRDVATIPAELIEMIMFATLQGNVVNFYVPVSFEDLFFQLYWYGFDVTLQDNPEPHEYGTHPTPEDIAKINLTYPDTHNGEVYRDFHNLTLGLTKV